MIYADSSFPVSCCLADANTARAKARLSTLTMPLPFTPLHELEVRNALQLCVFRGKFDATIAAAVWANLQQDLQAGRLLKVGAGSRRQRLSLRLALARTGLQPVFLLNAPRFPRDSPARS